MNIIGFQAVKDTPTTASFKLGERRQTPDGREWVYVKATEAISAGHVVVPTSTSVDTVSSSADALGRIVYITEASAGWTAGAYEDAWVYVDAGTGVGQLAKIKTNTADTLELYPEYALSTALDVSDSDITITLRHGVEKAAVTDKTQQPVGIAQVAFASGDYGFVLTRGDGIAIAGEALTAGQSFVTGDDTEGEVLKGTTAKGSFDETPLGYCTVANASADTAAHVFVSIQA